MTETIMKYKIIEKFNMYLDTNNNNLQVIINWIKSKSFSTNKTKVEVEMKDYVDFIHKLNNALSEADKCVKYNFASFIQEELENVGLEVRVCTSCLNLMIEGYVIDGGMSYYCSDKCLEYDMTLEEFEQAYGEGDTDTYWTEWF